MLLDLETHCPPRTEAVDFSVYASPFFEAAWAPDGFEMISLQTHLSGIELRLRVADHVGQGRFPFHLSNLAAAAWLQQMGVIFARWLDGDIGKPSFVHMIEFSIRCNKPINETEELVLSAVVEKSRAFGGGRLFVARFSVQGDKFTGRGRFIMRARTQCNSLRCPHEETRQVQG